MSIRAALQLFVLSLIVFAAAFALRRTFFADVMPVSWDQEPQSLWALGAAFLLRSIENISAVVGAIAFVVAIALRFVSRRTRNSPILSLVPDVTRQSTRRLGNSEVSAPVPVRGRRWMPEASLGTTIGKASLLRPLDAGGVATGRGKVDV
jgi:hypothetical protein